MVESLNSIVKVFEYESSPLTAIMYKNRPAFIAKEIGQRLGYSKGGSRLVDNITNDWAEEFIPDQDFVVLKGQELAEFKQLFKGSTDSVVPLDPMILNASQLMLLFRNGMNLAAIRCKKPEGVRLRRFLATEVIPQLLQDGSYSPDRTVNETGQMVARDGGNALAVADRIRFEELAIQRMREERLMVLANAEAQEKVGMVEIKRIDVESSARYRNAKAGRIEASGLVAAAKVSFAMGTISEDQYKASCKKAAEMQAGGWFAANENDSESAERLVTCSEIADKVNREFGVEISDVSVGKIVAQIGKDWGIENITSDPEFVVVRTCEVEYEKDGESRKFFAPGYSMKSKLHKEALSRTREKARRLRNGKQPELF